MVDDSPAAFKWALRVSQRWQSAQTGWKSEYLTYFLACKWLPQLLHSPCSSDLIILTSFQVSTDCLLQRSNTSTINDWQNFHVGLDSNNTGSVWPIYERMYKSVGTFIEIFKQRVVLLLSSQVLIGGLMIV